MKQEKSISEAKLFVGFIDNMSKIGKAPVKIPDGVEVQISTDVIRVSGSKGFVEVSQIPGILVSNKDSHIIVELSSEELVNGPAYWGLIRSLLNNAVIGASEGFIKVLEIVGVGYRVEKVGNNLRFFVGYSHSVEFTAPEGITLEVEGNTVVKVSGASKHMVGQTAANIRAIRKPEPYKGKGIKYKGEIIKRKQGKAAKA